MKIAVGFPDVMSWSVADRAGHDWSRRASSRKDCAAQRIRLWKEAWNRRSVVVCPVSIWFIRHANPIEAGGVIERAVVLVGVLKMW